MNNDDRFEEMAGDVNGCINNNYYFQHILTNVHGQYSDQTLSRQLAKNFLHVGPFNIDFANHGLTSVPRHIDFPIQKDFLPTEPLFALITKDDVGMVLLKTLAQQYRNKEMSVTLWFSQSTTTPEGDTIVLEQILVDKLKVVTYHEYPPNYRLSSISGGVHIPMEAVLVLSAQQSCPTTRTFVGKQLASQLLTEELPHDQIIEALREQDVDYSGESEK